MLKHKKWQLMVGIGEKCHSEVTRKKNHCEGIMFFLIAGNLSFEVDHKQAFEVPLKNVSNSNKGKNEITLQFHQAEDVKVSLMEIRFYVPQGDVDGDAVEVIIIEMILLEQYYLFNL
jgi:hypothetical protein